MVEAKSAQAWRQTPDDTVAAATPERSVASCIVAGEWHSNGRTMSISERADGITFLTMGGLSLQIFGAPCEDAWPARWGAVKEGEPAEWNDAAYLLELPSAESKRLLVRQGLGKGKFGADVISFERLDKAIPKSEAQKKQVGSEDSRSTKDAGKSNETRIHVRVAREIGNESLGIEVEESPKHWRWDGKTLYVNLVQANGLIPDWNAKRPDEAVRAGDRIVAANGRRGGAEQLLQECKLFRSLEIEVERPRRPPRSRTNAVSSTAAARQQESQVPTARRSAPKPPATTAPNLSKASFPAPKAAGIAKAVGIAVKEEILPPEPPPRKVPLLPPKKVKIAKSPLPMASLPQPKKTAVEDGRAVAAANINCVVNKDEPPKEAIEHGKKAKVTAMSQLIAKSQSPAPSVPRTKTTTAEDGQNVAAANTDGTVDSNEVAKKIERDDVTNVTAKPQSLAKSQSPTSIVPGKKKTTIEDGHAVASTNTDGAAELEEPPKKAIIERDEVAKVVVESQFIAKTQFPTPSRPRANITTAADGHKVAGANTNGVVVSDELPKEANERDEVKKMTAMSQLIAKSQPPQPNHLLARKDDRVAKVIEPARKAVESEDAQSCSSNGKRAPEGDGDSGDMYCTNSNSNKEIEPDEMELDGDGDSRGIYCQGLSFPAKPPTPTCAHLGRDTPIAKSGAIVGSRVHSPTTTTIGQLASPSVSLDKAVSRKRPRSPPPLPKPPTPRLRQLWEAQSENEGCSETSPMYDSNGSTDEAGYGRYKRSRNLSSDSISPSSASTVTPADVAQKAAEDAIIEVERVRSEAEESLQERLREARLQLEEEKAERLREAAEVLDRSIAVQLQEAERTLREEMEARIHKVQQLADEAAARAEVAAREGRAAAVARPSAAIDTASIEDRPAPSKTLPGVPSQVQRHRRSLLV